MEPEQVTSCDGKAEGEECDLAGIGTGTCDGGVCRLSGCGNGIVDLGERCDDGNVESGDGCRGDCGKLELCGDGAIDSAESCDDGAAGRGNPADGCDACVATAWIASALLGRELGGVEVGLAEPSGGAVDRAGNLFVADTRNHRIRRLDAVTGVMTTVAGSSAPGFSGDGGPATAARLARPSGVAVDGAGNLYIADTGNHRIRHVSAGTGVITTVAGIGSDGSSGDGGLATSAELSAPGAVVVDGLGDLFIADTFNHRIRRVAAATGVVTTIAGTGAVGWSGDGGPATSAQLYSPNGVAVDGAGNVVIADTFNHRIRRVAADTGVITTVAGSFGFGWSGDGGPATSAKLLFPHGVSIDSAGDMFIADTSNHRVRRVHAGTSIITTAAGTGDEAFSGDGGAATNAHLRGPRGVALARNGDLLIADTENNRFRRVTAGAGDITTVAGTGVPFTSGDGRAATSAQIAGPYGVAVTPEGDVLFTDGDRLRRVDAETGVVTTVAGTVSGGFSGDGGMGTSAQLRFPSDVAADAAGNLFIADTGNNRIRRIDTVTGVITTVAGTVSGGFSGDGGAATSAQLSAPRGVALNAAGDLFIADTNNLRIRRVDALTGVIATVAGTGIAGSSGDGDAAPNAQLVRPFGVAVDGAGHLFIADTEGHRVRRIDAGSGIITTVAGTGESGFSGDGGAAVGAQLSWPWSVAVDGEGSLFIADAYNLRVRRVTIDGEITTAVGTGSDGSSGDGGLATDARLRLPVGVALDAAGALVVADVSARRVRRVAPTTGVITTVAGAVAPEGMGTAVQATLADPRGLVLTPALSLVAGGETGTVQALWSAAQRLEAVAGRYPHTPATGDLARFCDESFGTVGGVAHDAALDRIYLSETTAHRLHVVTIVDAEDPDSWTIATLAGDATSAGGTAAFADGPALSARFDSPAGLYFDESARVLYIADAGNHVLRTLPIDVAGNAGSVATFAGTPRTLGIFGDGGSATDALLFSPQAVTRCASGDVFIADTANHRVRRVAAGSGVIATVLGDGVPASSGQGRPAAAFPVDTPLGLACDVFGNVLVTSRTAVRLLAADADGVVDGTGIVQTIYGAAPRTDYPASVTSCITGIAVVDAETVQFTDSCTGVLGELWRQPVS